MLTSRFQVILLVLSCLLLSACNRQKSITNMSAVNPETSPKTLPTTLFVHGTYLPVVTPVLHLDCKPGITQSYEYPNKYVLPKIGAILNSKNAVAFPIDTFYLFGWSGQLSLKGRRKAAEELYLSLKGYDHPITLICHSHGCNVALNLAAVAQEHNDTEFYIDRLILLAGPVQEATKKYIKSPIFKKIISFYSESDVFQVIDPQGLQYRKTKKEIIEQPLFSERLWPDDERLVQVKVLFGKTDPWHIDFILEKFMKYLPDTLAKLDQLQKTTGNRYYILTIDQKAQTIECMPHVLKK